MKHEAIFKKKRSTSIETLCKNLPGQYATYLAYCRALAFEEKPDYEHLRCLIDSCDGSAAKLRYGSKDFLFDWQLLTENDETTPSCLKSMPKKLTGSFVSSAGGRKPSPPIPAVPVETGADVDSGSAAVVRVESEDEKSNCPAQIRTEPLVMTTRPLPDPTHASHAVQVRCSPVVPGIQSAGGPGVQGHPRGGMGNLKTKFHLGILPFCCQPGVDGGDVELVEQVPFG